MNKRNPSLLKAAMSVSAADVMSQGLLQGRFGSFTFFFFRASLMDRPVQNAARQSARDVVLHILPPQPVTAPSLFARV